MHNIAGLYLILAVLSSALMAIILKIFSTEGENRYSILMGNYLACVIVGFLSLPEKSLILRMDGITFICSVIGGFLFTAGLVSMQIGIRINGAALTAAFARLGLIVPLMLSIFTFRERPGILQIAGILLVLAALWVISSQPDEREPDERGETERSERADRVNIPVLLMTLLMCGASDAMAKVYEQVGERAKDELYYMCIFLTAFLITCVLAYHEYRKTGKKVSGRMMLAGLAVGIPNYYSSFLLLKALVHLPAFIVYPCFSTGAILVVTLASALLLHEKLSRNKLAGLVLIMAALVLLNI